MVGLVEKNSIRAAIVLFETTADIVGYGAKSMYPNISCKNLSVGAFDNVPVDMGNEQIILIDAKSDRFAPQGFAESIFPELARIGIECAAIESGMKLSMDGLKKIKEIAVNNGLAIAVLPYFATVEDISKSNELADLNITLLIEESEEARLDVSGRELGRENISFVLLESHHEGDRFIRFEQRTSE